MYLSTAAEHDEEDAGVVLATHCPCPASNPGGDGVTWAEEWSSPKLLAHATDFSSTTGEVSCEDDPTEPVSLWLSGALSGA